MEDIYYTVSGDGRDHPVRLRPCQMQATVLGKIFGLYPQSIVLIAEDGTVATPSGKGGFDTEVLDDTVAWACQGNSCKPIGTVKNVHAYQPTDSLRSKRSNKKWTPLYNSQLLRKPPGVAAQEGARACQETQWSKTVDVCAWDGVKCDWKICNLPLALSDSSASIDGVSRLVSSEAFDGCPVVLLDADNLKIPDSAGTKVSV